MPAAADDKNQSSSWQRSPSIERACCSVFAGTVIAALTSATSPLLEHPSARSEAPEDSLQPEIPDAEQTASFDSFCRSILDTCSRSVPLNAEWEIEDESRTGGGCSQETEEAGIKAQIIAAEIKNDTREMAKLFLETCPGDNETPRGHSIRGDILEYIKGEEPDPDGDTDVPAMITYMLELTRLADYLVRIFDLPAPNQRCCLMWHRHEWGDKMRLKMGKSSYDTKRGAIWGRLWDQGIYPEQGPGQGPFSDRFVSYLAAAVVESDRSAEQDQEVAEQMAAFVDGLRRFHRERAIALALQNRDVVQRGREWLKKVCRSVRRSESPQKSPSREMRQHAESNASQHSRDSSRDLGNFPAFQPSTPARE